MHPTCRELPGAGLTVRGTCQSTAQDIQIWRELHLRPAPTSSQMPCVTHLLASRTQAFSHPPSHASNMPGPVRFGSEHFGDRFGSHGFSSSGSPIHSVPEFFGFPGFPGFPGFQVSGISGIFGICRILRFPGYPGFQEIPGFLVLS